ncbi:MAG: hypothetical protein GEU98_15035 [Pseudonocardiaceae bacterium]|nr:hypothetical protein [Pseudonocardiaceae bacterium]
MSVLAPILFFVLFAAIIGGTIWLWLRPGRKNRQWRDPATGQELASLAAEQGWSYTPERKDYLQRYGDRYPFHRAAGVGEPALDVVTGTHRGREFACFQFLFPRPARPTEGPAQRTYFRVFSVSLRASAPKLILRGAHLDPLWMRGFTTGDRAFDKSFVVGAGDNQFAHRILTEPVKQWLYANPPLAGVANGSLQFAGHELLGWYKEKDGFDVRLVEPVLDYLCDFLDRLPADALR